MVGLEETGFHEIYSGEQKNRVYQLLAEFLIEYKPASVLYIGEDLSVENMRKEFESSFSSEQDLSQRDQFLLLLKKKNIPVNFGAFGRRDYQQQEKLPPLPF